MLYSEYISKAKNMCIAIDDVNNVSYLMPDYRYMLCLSNLNLEDVTDFPGVTYDIVGENLKLEAEAYNARHNMVPGLAEWIRETLMTSISPLAAQQQNELIKNMSAYMEANLKQNEQKKQAAETEEHVKEQPVENNGVQGKILQMSEYMNFAKKK